MIDSPGFILFLLVVLLGEVGYILLDRPGNWIYFRDYIDAIIILAFLCAAYFIFEYFRNQTKALKRVAPLQKQTLRQSAQLQEAEIEKLTRS